MKVLQTISFLSLMLGASGIENQNGELQPVAIGIMFVALVVLLVTARKEYMHGGEDDVSAVRGSRPDSRHQGMGRTGERKTLRPAGTGTGAIEIINSSAL